MMSLVFFISLSLIVIHQIGARSLETVRKEPQTFSFLKQLISTLDLTPTPSETGNDRF